MGTHGPSLISVLLMLMVLETGQPEKIGAEENAEPQAVIAAPLGDYWPPESGPYAEKFNTHRDQYRLELEKNLAASPSISQVVECADGLYLILREAPTLQGLALSRPLSETKSDSESGSESGFESESTIVVEPKAGTDAKALTDVKSQGDELVMLDDYNFVAPAERGKPRYIALSRSKFIPFAKCEAPEKDKDGKGRANLLLTLAKEQVGPLADFTEKNLGRAVAIVVNGQIVTTHKIREKINDGRIQITRCSDSGCEVLYSILTKRDKK